MRKVGIYSTSGDKHTRLRNQMRRLFGCTVSLLYEDARGEATLNAPIARLTEFWWSERQPDARSLWESKIELGEDFFNEIIRCPIPIDLNTLRAMKRSPLGLDLSLWLTYRPAVGGPHLRLELGGCQVAETHVGTLFVVVPPPVFDPDLGLRPIPKPFQRQAFVEERAAATVHVDLACESERLGTHDHGRELAQRRGRAQSRRGRRCPVRQRLAGSRRQDLLDRRRMRHRLLSPCRSRSEQKGRGGE